MSRAAALRAQCTLLRNELCRQSGGKKTPTCVSVPTWCAREFRVSSVGTISEYVRTLGWDCTAYRYGIYIYRNKRLSRMWLEVHIGGLVRVCADLTL